VRLEEEPQARREGEDGDAEGDVRHDELAPHLGMLG
jgi:hypothetical protein